MGNVSVQEIVKLTKVNDISSWYLQCITSLDSSYTK